MLRRIDIDKVIIMKKNVTRFEEKGNINFKKIIGPRKQQINTVLRNSQATREQDG